MSHPALGAWIETYNDIFCVITQHSRTLHWVRGLKLYINDLPCVSTASRTLHWVRGLKLYVPEVACERFLVAPCIGCVD